MDRNTVSSSIYVVLVIVVIATRVLALPYGREIGVALLSVFLLLELWRAPPLQRNMGLALAGVGALAAAAGGELFGVLVEGLDRAQIFVVMFFAVTWLREPAVTSPILRELRDAVTNQPAGYRFPVLWLSVHMLGSVLNLAAMSLLSGMVSEQEDRRTRRRLSMALMSGFAAAATWGPFFVSIAVILTAVPGVRWLEIAPFGIVMSMLILAVNWSYDRLTLKKSVPSDQVHETGKSRLPFGTTCRIVGLLGILILLVMGAHEGIGMSIPIALGVIGPPFALIWAIVQAPASARWAQGGSALSLKIFKGLPSLRNETIAFVAASILGVGIATILPPEKIAPFLTAYDITGDAIIVVVIFGMVLAGAAGLHPLILVILIGEVLPPDVIGMPPAILALALLGVWGTATLVSPFSGTTLFMGRVAGVPSHVIAWRWNPPVIFLSCCMVAAYVVTIRHLFYV